MAAEIDVLPWRSATNPMASKTILLTGAAGFIGFHVAKRLLAQGHRVVGVDNLNAYYDPRLKEARLAELAPHPPFRS